MVRRSPLLCDGQALLNADYLIRANVADRRASFELYFDELPQHAGFLVVAGVETALELLSHPLPSDEAIQLAQRTAGLSDALANRLRKTALSVDIDAVPDGTVVFAGTPIVTVEGSFLEACLVGAVLEPLIEQATLVATRAARLHIAAGGSIIVDGSSARTASSEQALFLGRAAHVGGAAATTSAFVAAQLGIPFRAEAALNLGNLSPSHSSSDAGWGTSASDRLVDLGGHDEEARLLEARRLGTVAGGWIASGLFDSGAMQLRPRYELVALEEEGVWVPRGGTSDQDEVLAGSKIVARYVDATGRALLDVIHLVHERMQPARLFGAVKLAPLSRARLRDGSTLEAPESAVIGRERSIASRQMLPGSVTHLHSPGRFRVELSPGLLSLREPMSTRSVR